MGHMNIVIYLIQHNANADTPTVRGETSLHLAARANQTDIIRILLRNGATVDAKARVSYWGCVVGFTWVLLEKGCAQGRKDEVLKWCVSFPHSEVPQVSCNVSWVQVKADSSHEEKKESRPVVADPFISSYSSFSAFFPLDS